MFVFPKCFCTCFTRFLLPMEILIENILPSAMRLMNKKFFFRKLISKAGDDCVLLSISSRSALHVFLLFHFSFVTVHSTWERALSKKSEPIWVITKWYLYIDECSHVDRLCVSICFPFAHDEWLNMFDALRHFEKFNNKFMTWLCCRLSSSLLIKANCTFELKLKSCQGGMKRN